MSQPGLINELLEKVRLKGDNREVVKPTQVPMRGDIAKILDEQIPIEKLLDELSKRARANRRGEGGETQSLDVEMDEPTDSLTAEEIRELNTLAPIYGKEHYRDIIGMLLYLSRLTRPDIATAVSILSRYCQKPGLVAMKGLKSLCRYLLGTPKLGLKFREPPNGEKLQVRYYSDSNWPRGRPRLGYVAMLGWTDSKTGKFSGTAIDWSSKVSEISANSTGESELYASFKAIKLGLPLHKDLIFAEVIPDKPAKFFVDNSSVVSNFNKRLVDSDLRWVANKYLRILELAIDGTIEVEYTPTDQNPADVFTKCSIPHKEFVRYRDEMMGRQT